MTCGRQDLEARSYRSATGGKYVTRYFEENAKKYRESPDKTGLRGGAGWRSAERRGHGRIVRSLCVDARDRRKNNLLNWTILQAGADLAPEERMRVMPCANLSGHAARCMRRSKIKRKGGQALWACLGCAMRPCGLAMMREAVPGLVEGREV
ncbi:hypothetical protein MRS60_25510 [Burkholderia pyrrocinia]|uniref:hypothetical protein n=1 Tax=Burkholderia pyrrocinia TaxID=60550 RepID=UPI001FB30B5D|nr:hypothetical protein [Burkholderia pyrrocinia]UOB57555.1 hypothetical protein MRS60_25510 [Burkholderia pyrrocinia]